LRQNEQLHEIPVETMTPIREWKKKERKEKFDRDSLPSWAKETRQGTATGREGS
jgi:hypothetical protein